MSFEIQRQSENLSLFPDPLRFMCVLLEGFRNGSDSGTELEHNHQQQGQSVIIITHLILP